MQTIKHKSLKLIRTTPGLTATQIAHLIKEQADSTSSRLYKLCQKNLLKRKVGRSYRYNDYNTWRYYINE